MRRGRVWQFKSRFGSSGAADVGKKSGMEVGWFFMFFFSFSMRKLWDYSFFSFSMRKLWDYSLYSWLEKLCYFSLVYWFCLGCFMLFHFGCFSEFYTCVINI